MAMVGDNQESRTDGNKQEINQCPWLVAGVLHCPHSALTGGNDG